MTYNNIVKSSENLNKQNLLKTYFNLSTLTIYA